jgi:hypothetical protein
MEGLFLAQECPIFDKPGPPEPEELPDEYQASWLKIRINLMAIPWEAG